MQHQSSHGHNKSVTKEKCNYFFRSCPIYLEAILHACSEADPGFLERGFMCIIKGGGGFALLV